jgi:hypothetical protein
MLVPKLLSALAEATALSIGAADAQDTIRILHEASTGHLGQARTPRTTLVRSALSSIKVAEMGEASPPAWLPDRAV